jgi:hypothetical protein
VEIFMKFDRKTFLKTSILLVWPGLGLTASEGCGGDDQHPDRGHDDRRRMAAAGGAGVRGFCRPAADRNRRQ